MNIGIELRQPVLGESGGVALLLRGILKALFDHHPGDQFTVFRTDFNRDLLLPAADHVRVTRSSSARAAAQLLTCISAIARFKRTTGSSAVFIADGRS